MAEAENAIAVMERKKRMKDDYKENLLAQIEETKQAIERTRASKLVAIAIELRDNLTMFKSELRNVKHLCYSNLGTHQSWRFGRIT